MPLRRDIPHLAKAQPGRHFGFLKPWFTPLWGMRDVQKNRPWSETLPTVAFVRFLQIQALANPRSCNSKLLPTPLTLHEEFSDPLD